MGTTLQGRQALAEWIYFDPSPSGGAGPGLSLVAYTNAADSFSASSVLADITQPTSTNGYAPISLDGTWVAPNGVLSYTHSTILVDANPNVVGWTATGAWSATVNGVAVVSATKFWHWFDLSTPFVAASGEKLGIDLATVVT